MGLIAASPATAAEKPSAKAKAAGDPAVDLTYPSIVQVRVNRTENALERATKKIENGRPEAEVANTLKVVRRQLGSAWRGARYVIRTTPPPPPEEDAGAARVRAHKSGDPTGPTLAAPADTAFRVLTLQHQVATETVQLIDGAHGTGLDALSTTLYFALDRRDQAIQDILTLAPPVPCDPEDEDCVVPGADEARVRARAAGDPVASTFETVMPNVPAQLDDETQAITGTLTDATDLTAGGQRLLNLALPQIAATETVVNTNWPPIPAED